MLKVLTASAIACISLQGQFFGVQGKSKGFDSLLLPSDILLLHDPEQSSWSNPLDSLKTSRDRKQTGAHFHLHQRLHRFIPSTPWHYLVIVKLCVYLVSKTVTSSFTPQINFTFHQLHTVKLMHIWTTNFINRHNVVCRRPSFSKIYHLSFHQSITFWTKEQ